MFKAETAPSSDRDRLCDITTTLVPQFGGRPEAFKEAVRRNPHLDSTFRGGIFNGVVVPGTKRNPTAAVAPVAVAVETPLDRLFKENAKAIVDGAKHSGAAAAAVESPLSIDEVSRRYWAGTLFNR